MHDISEKPPSARSRSGRRARSSGRLRQALTGYAFIAPLLVGIALFQLYPMITTTVASFMDWDGLTSPTFVGFDNFQRLLFDDSMFHTVVLNTFLYMAGAIPLTMVLALALATLISPQRRIMVVFRLAFFVPFVANVVAISVVWFRLYSGETGVLNDILGTFGIDGPDWLVTMPWAMVAVIIASVWQGVGYPMIVLMAGIQAIPTTLYEAADLDGASRWRRFRSITLPLLTPSLFFVSISQFVASFQVFGIVYVMTKGGPGSDTNVYLLHLFDTAFGAGELGYASAMAWLLFLVIAALTAIQWRLQRRWVFYE
ncbi:carbohydrate ABC transporter permease [Streptomyces sp. SBT349]|uniref:carbohydrate ABC transporter permease n=1 Tax=Streptomyces sp. SBT349 TaxID=1580539 RepID=UPI00066EF882|nr:sugar ABC transporter permease [Streptomyces sp. SBT349]